MNPLVIAAAVAAAAVAVSVPAVAGLTDNPSFSHRVSVQVPSHARVVQFDDHGSVVSQRRRGEDPTSTRLPSVADTSGSSEPGDDNGLDPSDAADDNGVDPAGAADDNGVDPSAAADDNGVHPSGVDTTHRGKGGHGGR
jgi:hypothetical protein